MPYAARILTGAGVGVAVVTAAELVGATPALPPHPMTIAVLIAIAPTFNARPGPLCHLPHAQRARPPGRDGRNYQTI